MNSAVHAPADADWYRHFGFDRDPFAEGGVHGLFYPGGARQEIVEQLLHLARFSDCVLLVAGVPGAGKSATRRHFAAQTGADTRCCVVEAALLDGPEQWLRRVLAGFGLRPGPSAELDGDLRSLAEHCAARSAAGSRCWLVIDDAHDLHEDVVAVLPHLLAATAPHLRLVLFAEPRWRGTLHAALPPDVALHTLELQPFDQGETYAYIHYRLNTAGLDGEPPFNGQEFLRIHQQSGGVPGRINALAREILCSAAEEVQQPLSALPLWHFAVIAVTFIALLLLYVWGAMDQDDHRPSRPPHPQGAAAGKPATGDVPSLQIAPAPAEPSDPAPESTSVAPEATPADNTPTSPIELPSQPDVIEPAEFSEPDEPAEPSGSDEPSAATPVAQTPRAQSPEAPRSATVTKPEPASGTAEPAAAPQPDKQAPASVAPEIPEQHDAAPASAPSSAPEPVAPGVERSPAAATEDEATLLAMDPAHFVLQIMGSDDGARVRAFAARSDVPLRLFRKLHNGRDWFALVHGEYPTRAAAEAAVSTLPESLRSPRPWVRRVGGIQQEIRDSRTR